MIIGTEQSLVQLGSIPKIKIKDRVIFVVLKKLKHWA